MDKPPHILVVDDDREILDLLSHYLETQGFRATPVDNGSRARDVLAEDPADLVVLDIMLPGESGLDFCRKLRRSSTTPVIMLTALGDTVDRVVGLELGADDYLSKPFDPRELVSRIRAVLRRSTPAQDAKPAADAYRFAGWRLDRRSRSLSDESGTRIELGGAEYRVLELLLVNAGRVLTRAELMEELRGREHDPFDRSIDVRVSRLRQLLGDDGSARRLIKTVYGEGYTLGVAVEPE